MKMRDFTRAAVCAALTIVLSSGCDKLTDDTEDTGPDAAVTAGVAGFSAAVNSANDSTTGTFRVVGCGKPAISDTCTDKVKKAVYEGCSTERVDYSGSVTLTFSDATCSMANNGSEVVRTFNVKGTLKFPLFPRLNGKTVEANSDSHTTYDNTTVGGGGKIIRVDATHYLVSVAGRRQLLKGRNDKILADQSIMTSSSHNVTGPANPFSGQRTVDGGELVVYHNLAKYTAKFVPSNVVFGSDGCCHPTAGTINVTYTGSVTGTATVTFDAANCGVATFTKDGKADTVFLQGCL